MSDSRVWRVLKEAWKKKVVIFFKFGKLSTMSWFIDVATGTVALSDVTVTRGKIVSLVSP